MTDTAITFRGSDDIHIVSIYIRSDADMFRIVNRLSKICNQIDDDENLCDGRLNWDYYCFEIVKRLSNGPNITGKMSFWTEESCENPTVINKIVIKPDSIKYRDTSFQTTKTLKISLEHPILKRKIHYGFLSDANNNTI